MRTRIIEERIGEDVGPVDWTHDTASSKPIIWRDAESDPNGYLFNGRRILAICMYDGWPYWTPTPAVQFIGPMNTAEWSFFNSYGVHSESIAVNPRATYPVYAVTAAEVERMGSEREVSHV